MTMAAGDARCHLFAMTSNRLPAAAVLTAALLLGRLRRRRRQGWGHVVTNARGTKAELIEYDHDDAAGVVIAKPADVAKLKGAPDDFKQFVAGIVDASKTLPEDDCQFTVGIAKVDTSGFAAGSMHSCGGAVYIWAKRDGVWQEIWAGQELPLCDDLKKYSVPKAIGGDKCYDDKNMKDAVEYTG